MDKNKFDRMNYKAVSIPKMLFFGFIGFAGGWVINRMIPENLIFIKYLLIFMGAVTVIFLFFAIKSLDKKIEALLKELEK